MRLRATDRRGGKGLTALLLALAAGIGGLQLPGHAQAMVGGAPPAPAEFGHSVVMILRLIRHGVHRDGDRPRPFAPITRCSAASLGSLLFSRPSFASNGIRNLT